MWSAYSGLLGNYCQNHQLSGKRCLEEGEGKEEQHRLVTINKMPSIDKLVLARHLESRLSP